MKGGHRLRLLVGGAETLAAIEGAIEGARERVWLETFIFRPDRVGRRVLRLLQGAARRGVDVVLVLDGMGSLLVSPLATRRLRSDGVRVVRFNPPLRPHVREGVRTLLYRDHRKILIADDRGYCGGHNISSAYLGPGKRAYFDITLEVRGPCVEDLAGVLRETLARAGQALPGRAPAAPIPGGVPAAVERLDRRCGVDEADPALADIVGAARDRCFLMLAYFLPERWLIEALSAAVRRGVDVRVLLAGKTDIVPSREAARHLYGDLLGCGVRIFELGDQKLHAKAVVADAEQLMVGSFDYNRLSARYSLEVSVSAQDRSVGARLEEVFCANLGRAREVSLADWSRRGRIARLAQTLSFGLVDRTAARADG